MDQSKNHFLYDPVAKDLKFFEHPDKWNVTGHEAADYLKIHVIGSLEGDVPPILDLFEKAAAHEGKGFFAMLRVTVPYLTWASKLLCLKGTEADKATAFLDQYADLRYKGLGRWLYEIYRHGLMHNHFPNVLIERKPQQIVGWKISLDGNEHLQVKSVQMSAEDTGSQLIATVISVCPRQLYLDVHCALQKYVADLEAGKFLNEFCIGFKSK